MNKRLLEEFTKRNLTLAIGESCTGGLLASYIVSIPGASKYFLGGIIAYSNDIKMRILGVRKETIEKYGAVSEECVKEMVLGIAKLFKSDVSIAITGIAGPSGGTKEKPVGLVYIAILHKNLKVEKQVFSGERNEIREKVARRAIEILIDNIIDE